MHVLSTPPAFILSQDQTLMLKSLSKVHTRLRRASRAFVKQEYILAFLIAFAKITLGYLSLVLLFGLLISQRPRMLDFCPPIDCSIFISLGIFKVVLLFNYQCFVCFFRNSLFIISYLFFLVKNFFIFLFFPLFFVVFCRNNVLYLITSPLLCQQLFLFYFFTIKTSKKITEKEGFEPSRRY